MSIFIPLLNLILLVWLSYRMWKSETDLQRIFWPALILKLMAGITVGLVYTFYYEVGDTFAFFHDGKLLAAIARDDFQYYWEILWSSDQHFLSSLGINFEQPRALFQVKLVSLFNLISYDNYWIIALYFSFFSFLASWFLLKRINRFIPEITGAAAIAFLFFPSVVFWSSGLIKESLSVAGLFFLSGLFLSIWFSAKVRAVHWVIGILSAWILWNLKYYFAGVFFAVVLTGILYRFLVKRTAKQFNFFVEIIFWMTLLIIPLSLISIMHPNFYPEKILRVIVDNYQAFRQLSAPEDLIYFRDLRPATWSILHNAPWALFSGIFRPFISEAHNILQLIVAMENLLMLILCCYSLYTIGRVFRSTHRMLFFAVVVYITSLCVFMTLSAPNFGTLSRYRVSYLPYFILLILCDKRIITFLQRSLHRLVLYKR